MIFTETIRQRGTKISLYEINIIEIENFVIQKLNSIIETLLISDLKPKVYEILKFGENRFSFLNIFGTTAFNKNSNI